MTWIIEDEFAKLDQSVISFSYSKKDTSTTTPILLNIADKLVLNNVGGEEEAGLLPGFELVVVVSALVLTGYIRRKV